MHKTYLVEGMTCCGCANAVEQAIKTAVPNAVVDVNVAAGEVTVDGDYNDALIKSVIEEAGFDYCGLA